MFRRKKQAILTLLLCVGTLSTLLHIFNVAPYVSEYRMIREFHPGRHVTPALSSEGIKSFINKQLVASVWSSQQNSPDDVKKENGEGEGEGGADNDEDTYVEKGDDNVPLPYEKIQDQYFKIKHRQALLHGNFRNYTSFLTIGVPTVKRKGVSYLDRTLGYLNKSTAVPDQKEVVIVVFFTDKDHDWIISESDFIYKKYKKQVDSGFIQLVHPHHNSYPNFTRLERTYNDSVERVAWRSKQNLDYAYLFTYCQNVSEYYMQIEDDVVVSKTYLRDIKRYVTSRAKNWFVLSFSKLGFIGKLFRSKDLSILADFLLMFFAEKPGDLLLNDLRLIKGQRKEIQFRPSLFQHIGIISSLKNKKQLLFEKGFRGENIERKKFYHDNPPASLETDMEQFEGYAPENAYNISETYFWAVTPPSKSYFRVLFNTPQNISRIFIASGAKTKPQDIIRKAAINVAVYDTKEEIRCRNFKTIGHFPGAVFDTLGKTQNITVPSNVDCLSIDLTEDHKNWVILSEIAIFTR